MNSNSTTLVILDALRVLHVSIFVDRSNTVIEVAYLKYVLFSPRTFLFGLEAEVYLYPYFHYYKQLFQKPTFLEFFLFFAGLSYIINIFNLISYLLSLIFLIQHSILMYILIYLCTMNQRS